MYDTCWRCHGIWVVLLCGGEKSQFLILQPRPLTFPDKLPCAGVLVLLEAFLSHSALEELHTYTRTTHMLLPLPQRAPHSQTNGAGVDPGVGANLGHVNSRNIHSLEQRSWRFWWPSRKAKEQMKVVVFSLQSWKFCRGGSRPSHSPSTSLVSTYCSKI